MIDCHAGDVDAVVGCWANAPGRPVDDPPGRANYRIRETPPDERAEHESRVRIDIDVENDDTTAVVARLEKLGSRAVDRPVRWVVVQAPAGQRLCVVRVQRPGFPKNASWWGYELSVRFAAI
jgi:Glyoxalase-like domain